MENYVICTLFWIYITDGKSTDETKRHWDVLGFGAEEQFPSISQTHTHEWMARLTAICTKEQVIHTYLSICCPLKGGSQDKAHQGARKHIYFFIYIFLCCIYLIVTYVISNCFNSPFSYAERKYKNFVKLNVYELTQPNFHWKDKGFY